MAYNSKGYKPQGKAQRGVCKYNDRELRFLCMKLQPVEKADCLFDLFNKTSHELLHFLKYLNETEGKTIVMVTHDAMIASYTKKLVFLRDGKIEEIIEKLK